jgi:putative chitinase
MSWRDTQLKLVGFGYSVAVDGVPGPQTYGALFSYMGAKDNASLFGRAAADFFPEYGLTSPLRVAHWLAQFGVESRNFTQLEEDLSYSAQRLCAVWPSRFPTLASALDYAHNPRALAEKVYGGRMGNTAPGDGWRYRGRGPGLTGKANYADCASRTGLDLVNHPELASDPANFVRIACDFWAQHGCNPLADADDFRAITYRINGGYNGLAERAQLLTRAEGVLG